MTDYKTIMGPFGTIDTEYYDFIDKEKKELVPRYNDEINAKLGNDYWNTLGTFKEGEVLVHTSNVLYLVLNNQLYAKLSPFY